MRLVAERAGPGESEQKLRMVIDGLGPNTFLGLLSPQGVVIEANRPALLAAGLRAEEVLGQPFEETYWWSYSQAAQRRLQQALTRAAAGEPSRYDVQVRLAGGRLVWVDFVLNPVRDHAGRVIYLVPSGNVIDERVRAQAAVRESEERFSLAFRGSPTAIAICQSASLQLLEVNDAFLRLFCCAHTAIIGQSLAELGLFDEGDLQSMRVELGRVGSVESMQLAALSRERRPLQLNLAVRTFQMAGEWCALVTLADVTEAKRAEQAVRDSEAYFHFLDNLSQATRLISDAEQIMAVATRMLGQHLRASRCAYADVEPNGNHFSIRHDYTDGCASTVGNYLLEQFGALSVTTLGLGQTLIIRDIDVDLPVEQRATFRSIGIAAIVVCPLRKDGVLRAMMAVHQSTPRDWQAGEVRIVQDVVERCWATIERRAADERFYTMANSMPQLAWIAQADGYIFWYNQRWYEYTGKTAAQMVGWGWQSVHAPESLGAVMRNWTEAIACGKPFEMEFPLQAADGSFRTFLTRGHPLKNALGQVVQWFGTNTDVHALKVAEERVRVLNTELEKRVLERTAELQAVNKELEAFSYSVSHDLRAPLRGIHGFVRMLQEDYGPQLDVEANRLIGVVSGEAKRMGRLIDDLLSFSRMSRQPMSRDTVDMGKLAQAAFDSVCGNRTARCPEFQLQSLPSAQGDPAMLRQVFENLLSNAVKFSGKRADAVIRVGSCAVTRPGESEVNLENTYFVQDNGAGFDPRYRDKLFEVFQRLHSEAEFEGTGVGLALVQRIVQRHGGQIWAEAVLEKGATFYFSLPSGHRNE